MKKILAPVLLVLMAFMASCSKEKTTLNNLKGRWKATELKVDNYPPGPPEYQFYLTFEACKPEETCTVTMEVHYDNGSVDTQSDTFHLIDEDRFVYGNDTCNIVHLDKTELIYSITIGSETTHVTFEKQ